MNSLCLSKDSRLPRSSIAMAEKKLSGVHFFLAAFQYCCVAMAEIIILPPCSLDPALAPAPLPCHNPCFMVSDSGPSSIRPHVLWPCYCYGIPVLLYCYGSKSLNLYGGRIMIFPLWSGSIPGPEIVYACYLLAGCVTSRRVRKHLMWNGPASW